MNAPRVLLLVAASALACGRAPAREDTRPRSTTILTQSVPKLAAAEITRREPSLDRSGLHCLRQAYPEQVCDTEPNTVVLCSGARLRFDDGRPKSHAERLEQPDLEDMFAQPYALDAALPPGPGIEPGRVRALELFAAMYGSSEREVRNHLTTIRWLSRKPLQVSQVNGVHRRLQAVSDALERLPEPLRSQAREVAGTFNYRNVKGTARKSAHSYGIAIDVAPALSDYWQWRERGQDPPTRYRNRMPTEIVAAFEREGFIWGGRWNHYDTMHFEYRPELLVPECRADVAAQSEAQPAIAWQSAATADRLEARFAPPAGYQRPALSAGSFGAWLRQLPLRPAGTPVKLHDGSLKGLQTVHAAVVDIDVGTRDLQQCADAVMRLRAEYLFGAGRGDEVCFRSASGDAMPYEAYRRGLRPPPGRGSPWSPLAAADTSHDGFRKYLDRVFGIANTASLSRELEAVADPRQLQAGDVYIQAATGGRFGHAVLIVDVADDTAGNRVFLIAQSYMPAQDIHVLRNPFDRAIGPWYRAPADGSLRTPEWEFPAHALRRFARSCSTAQ